MREVQVDVSDCKYLEEIHELIAKELKFPDYYRVGLDALWDCLTGYIELPVKIHFKGTRTLKKKLQEPFLEIFAVFQEAADQYGQIEVTIE